MSSPAELEAAFSAGKHARLHEHIDARDNPHIGGDRDMLRKWYEGWCEGNMIQYLTTERAA